MLICFENTYFLLILQAVDAALVKDVCFRYIYDKCPVVAAVGPVENLLDYNRIRYGVLIYPDWHNTYASFFFLQGPICTG